MTLLPLRARGYKHIQLQTLSQRAVKGNSHLASELFHRLYYLIFFFFLDFVKYS